MTDRELDRLLRARAAGERVEVAPAVARRLDGELDQALRGAGKSGRRYARVLLAAALILAALAGIAYAAVRAGYIRGVLLGGDTDVAESRVIPVGEARAEGALSVAIDEAFWEGDRLYLSYTARVSGDGQYLLAFAIPTLDGAPMSYQYGQFIADGTVFLIGGEEKEIAGVFAMIARADGEPHEVALEAWLLDPLREVRGASADEFGGVNDSRGEGALYYVEGEESWLGGGARIAFGGYQTMMGLYEVGMLEDRGIAKIADSVALSFPLDGAAQAQNPVNGVAEEEFALERCTLRVRSFSLSHMGMHAVVDIYPEDRDDPAFPWLRFDIQTPEGVSILDGLDAFQFGGGSGALDERGVFCYEYDISGSGFLPRIPEMVVLAPFRWDERSEQRVYDENLAVTVALVAQGPYDPIPDGMAYATERGTWYHGDIGCGGMIGAQLVGIAAAEARGQTPCPNCVR